MVPSSSAIDGGKRPAQNALMLGLVKVPFLFLSDQTYHQAICSVKGTAVNKLDLSRRSVHSGVDLVPRALPVSRWCTDPSNRNEAHPIRVSRHHSFESMPKTNKIRTHYLKNCDLPSLLEPAPAHEATWTATKGT